MVAQVLLALTGVISAIIGVGAVMAGLKPDGSDIQLILAALLFLISVVSFVGAAIISRMDEPKPVKEHK